MNTARTVFITVLAVTVLLILVTVPQLPPVVASHFGADNLPNGAMTRDGYRNFMLLFVIAVPLLASLPLGWLPARFPETLNIPNRDYWLAPEHRKASLQFLRDQGDRLATLLVVFMGLVHFTLIKANSTQPAQLPVTLFFSVLLAFLVGMGWWAYRLTSHFRKPS
jgi:hypothetical protein